MSYRDSINDFRGITSGIGKLTADFLKGVNEFLDYTTVAGRARIGSEQAQKELSRYSRFLTALTKQAEVDAAKIGADQTTAANRVLEKERRDVTSKLLEAQLQLAEVNRKIDGSTFGANTVQKEQQVEAFKSVEALKIQKQAIEEVQQAREKAARDAAMRPGLLATYRLELKALQDQREAALSRNDVVGENGLNQRITAKQKQIDDLLEKVNKSAIAQENKLLAALKSLQAEERKLTQQYDRAVLDNLKDQGQARAAEQLRQDQQAIAQLEKILREKELAVRKAGGRGTDADGVIDGVQRQELDNLRVLAEQRFQDELDRIGRDYAARRLALQRDSDAKELAQLQAKLAEEIRVEQRANDALGESIERAARDGNQSLALSLGASKLISDKLLAELRAAAVEQEGLLRRQQALNAIDRQEKARIDGINAGDAGPTQATDVTADGSGAALENAATKRLNLVQRLMKRATDVEVDLEKKKQRDILEAQMEANRARLVQYENDFSAQGIAIKTGLIDTNKVIADTLSKLQAPAPPKLNIYKLILGEDDNEENRQRLDAAVSQSLTAVNTILQAQLQASQAAIDAKTREIDGLERELDRQLQYAKEGSAANIAQTRADLNAAKSARREALADQKKAARQQQLVQDLTAVSSISLAVADIIAGWSKIPLVGSLLGILAAGAMVTSFVAVKARIKNTAQSQSEGFFKGGLTSGGYTGNGDPREESRAIGARPYTYHKREFVANHELTDKYYGPLFNPLHQGRPQDIDWTAPQMRVLLPDYSLPAKLREERQVSITQQLHISNEPLRRELQEMRQELAEIKKHTASTASRPHVFGTEDDYTELDLTTRSTRRLITEK